MPDQRGLGYAGARGVVEEGARGPPLNIRNNENKRVFYKRTFKVCINCSWLCPETSAPSSAHLKCPCISVVLEAMRETERRKLKEGIEKRSIFPQQGIHDLSSRQINVFYLSGSPNVWLLATLLFISPPIWLLATSYKRFYPTEV